jgi:hypothetical protein
VTEFSGRRTTPDGDSRGFGSANAVPQTLFADQPIGYDRNDNPNDPIDPNLHALARIIADILRGEPLK